MTWINPTLLKGKGTYKRHVAYIPLYRFFVPEYLTWEVNENRQREHNSSSHLSQLAVNNTNMGLPQFTSSSNEKDDQSSHVQQQGTPVGAGANTGAGVTREKTEAEKEADRLYEEAMEEEYAKREGGS